MTRPRAEIMRDLKAILAELDYVMGNDTADTGEFSPKLKEALEVTQRTSRDTRAYMPSIADAPIESHEDIRAKARAYKPEKPEHLKDYKPTSDPNWNEEAFMGSGDRDPLGHDDLAR